MPADSVNLPWSAAARGGVVPAREQVWLLRLGRDQAGAAFVEYLVLLALLGLGVIVGVRALSGSMSSAASELGLRVAALSAEPLSGLGSGALPAPPAGTHEPTQEPDDDLPNLPHLPNLPDLGGGGGGSSGSGGEGEVAGHPIKDYLTGETPVPDDFAEVMGYTPVEVETPYGTRMIRGDGECSAPVVGNTGRSFDFTPPCQTHDLGYDLVRYADRVGLPHDPEVRRAADQQFRDDMFGHCSETRSYFNEATCKGWANIYSGAVNANSERQGHGVP